METKQLTATSIPGTARTLGIRRNELSVFAYDSWLLIHKPTDCIIGPCRTKAEATRFAERLFCEVGAEALKGTDAKAVGKRVGEAVKKLRGNDAWGEW